MRLYVRATAHFDEMIDASRESTRRFLVPLVSRYRQFQGDVAAAEDHADSADVGQIAEGLR